MEQNPNPSERSRSGVTLAVVIGVAVVVAAAIYFPSGRSGRSTGPGMPSPLPFGAAEQSYAAKVQFGDFAISRAENYLHQEVTTLTTGLRNTGDRLIREMEVTLEFHDVMRQVVLREPRRILNSSSVPLAAGETRTFEISFEHLPDLWDRQAPAIRVTGLRFN